jgi:hypothetical protein
MEPSFFITQWPFHIPQNAVHKKQIKPPASLETGPRANKLMRVNPLLRGIDGRMENATV